MNSSTATSVISLHTALFLAVVVISHSCVACDQDVQWSEFDFIVVGAGSAGAVVASRLSERPDWQVLLLEAGGDETTVSQIPGLAGTLPGSHIDWNYKAEPQDKACLAMVNNQSVWTRGKVLGGTSSLNYMVYARGGRGDFDGWASRGNPGWSYNDILPYMKKSEGNRNFNDQYHGTDGPQTVETLLYHTPSAESFIEGASALGYEKGDTNGARLDRAMLVQLITRNGSRCSTNKAFLKPAACRPNLVISTYSHATKILINSDTNTAYGVEYSQDGKVKTATVRKEVILSAGALNSPQLLMLSGIGPKSHLESLGIRVLQDLPGVGHNLQDHIACGGLQFILNDSVTFYPPRVFSDTNNFLTYLATGKGPLSSSGVEALAFVYTPFADRETEEPDIELIQFSFSLGADGGHFLKTAINIKPEVYEKWYVPLNGKDVVSIWPILERPKSRGSVQIRSADPFEPPVMYPNYLTDPEDVAVLVEGVKLAVALGESEGYAKYGARLYSTPIPGCECHIFRSDAYWECAARHLTATVYHFSGTCKMGPSSDKMAVVDPELRVYGIQQLRVADASIMPQVTTGHTNIPTIMIGEKAADMIKDSY